MRQNPLDYRGVFNAGNDLKIARPIKAASAGASRIAELEISEVEELPRSHFAELDAQARSFNAMLGALRWFQTYVPRSLVRRLIRRGEGEIASEERDLTVLFTDLVSFTSTAESMSASETADLLTTTLRDPGKVR